MSINAMQPCASGNPSQVFRNHRYAPDHPALVDRELTPLGPIELYNTPPPVPDGSGNSSPLRVRAPTPAGALRVLWDPTFCTTAQTYHLLYGQLAAVASYALDGAVCGIGVQGQYAWANVPAGDLFFLIVGVDAQGCLESSWGVDGWGNERNGPAASGMCGVTLKDSSADCP